MEQNSANLAKGILTGCFVAVLVMSLATKSHASEIIKPLLEQTEDLVSKSVVPAIYYGSRHSYNEERDIWGLSNEQPSDRVAEPEISA
ncbi:MAG: hypothetical protein GY927_24835 [bacterium]|nr:hypothetical protein [bacterium]